MKIYITQFDGVHFESDSSSMVGCTNDEFVRFIKTSYNNYERFMSRYVNVLKEKLADLNNHDTEAYARIIKFVDFIVENYDDARPLTFVEAFKLEDSQFQALVFTAINVPDMIKELGATRYKTDGIEVNHRKYDNDGKLIGTEPYHNIYEVWEVSGEKLGLSENVYALKCWCTSTNKEHWLWFDNQYKDDPLSAVASTFMIHEDAIEHISALKRHGDVLICEMKDDYTPTGNIVPLNKEQYFSLLVAQS